MSSFRLLTQVCVCVCVKTHRLSPCQGWQGARPCSENPGAVLCLSLVCATTACDVRLANRILEEGEEERMKEKKDEMKEEQNVEEEEEKEKER